MPGLGISFGRGGATGFQQDLQNSDCILIQGSNMAECHPVGFQWVMEAKERGATIIHVDPRYTRTSAMSSLHVPIRVGSDIAFLGGIVRYILENERYFKDYVVHYTNAPAIIREDFRDTEELGGLFSGRDASRSEPVARPLRTGASGALWKAFKVCTVAGLGLALWPGRQRWKKVAASALTTVGALAMRFAFFHGGKASARDPQATFRSQRDGLGAAEVGPASQVLRDSRPDRFPLPVLR